MTIFTESTCSNGNLTVDVFNRMKEKLKPVVYYGLSDEQTKNVIVYVTPKIGLPFCILHPDDLQMAIDNTPGLLWRPIKEMGI